MPDFDDFILRGREGRGLEYKAPRPWRALRAGIAKTALGMANLRDGGVIVIGVEEDRGPGHDQRGYKPVGLKPEDLRTYGEDDVRSFINTHADPHIEVDVHRHELESAEYIIIVVREFDLVPIVARRHQGKDIRQGAIYTRTRKPETVEVPDSAYMREIVDLATEKALERQLAMWGRIGLPVGQLRRMTDDEEFERERGGL